MSCRTETKEIEEIEYSVRQWPAEKAMTMKFKLVQTFGIVIASLASLSESDEKDNLKALSEGLSSLFKTTSPEEVTALMKSCLIGVARDGTKITNDSFNVVFAADDLMVIYKVFVFVIQVNFGNFIKGQLVENLLVKMKENL